MPFRIRADQIVDFFQGYGSLCSSDVFIESSGGRSTGQAVVLFESDQYAQDAKEALDGQDLGGRKAFLKDHTHHDMKNACNL